jgi:hypothetical protein
MDSKAGHRERDCYPAVKRWLESRLNQGFASVYLEVTADRTFSNTLKAQIDRNRDLIFTFLREAAPDLAGFVKKDSSSPREFLVMEVKARPIKLDDVYQTRKYAELFDARYALLLSTCEVPEEISRLSQVLSPYLLALPAYKKLTLVTFRENGGYVAWFPDDPFG